MWEELGISGGTAVIILIALYFIIKWGVKNGVKEAYKEMKIQNILQQISEKEVRETDEPEA